MKKRSIEINTDEIKLKAVLVGVELREAEDTASFERSVLELSELARACDIEVVSIISQKLKAPVAASYVGEGKIEEIKSQMYALDAHIAVFDQSLSPVQIRNLSRELDCEVIDRTDLILRIFSDRARTKEARLQVEYAKLEYMLPRLAGLREGLSRQGGGSGFRSSKGAGETRLELDRRKILNKQSLLRKELKEIEQKRNEESKKRNNSDTKRIGLVGYTNAGKSTLMNRLLSLSESRGRKDKEVFVRDMLFATLDTTVRRVQIYGHEPFLLSDTVGFIDNLPTALIKAFRSTLREAALSDLILVVIDCADPDYKAKEEVTLKTLKEIGAGNIPVIYVMNKIDMLPDEEKNLIMSSCEDEAVEGILSGRIRFTVGISASTGTGVDSLLGIIDKLTERL